MGKSLNEKGEEYINYEDILTNDEIILYAQIIDEFSEDKISYKELEQKFLSVGIKVQPLLFERTKILWFSGIPSKEMEDKFRASEERIAKKEYKNCDINNYILSSNKFQNVLFSIDNKVVEILANAGNLKYKRYLIGILNSKLKYSNDSTPEMVSNRRKWRQRIDELELELAKTNKQKAKTY